MANEKLRELVVKWRKTITDCPAVNREKWGQVFDAVSTCANELEAALAAEEPAPTGEYICGICERKAPNLMGVCEKCSNRLHNHLRAAKGESA